MSIWYSTSSIPEGVPLQRGAWLEAFDIATLAGWRPQDEGYFSFTAEECRQLAAIWLSAIEGERAYRFTEALKRLVRDWSDGPVEVSR